MKTNLIQNYILNHNTAMGNNMPSENKDFDIHEQLYNRTFIKPLPPTAKLIDGGILNAPKELVKDWFYETKSLKDGIQGKANDHQLGKLNDVGLKIGGLAIACYLAARKTTPLKKAMEFIGFGSFLLAMSIWPKLAIQLPTKLIHGTNSRQSYEDSFGRKKPLTLDTQFLPFDLYSEKQIEKIGNWQRVPKDIPNRRQYIEEKMRKNAVQNNTLWMLTAGFATPVMSGLICNAVTPYTEKQLMKYRNKMTEQIQADFSQSVKKAKSSVLKEQAETFINLYKERPLNENMIMELSDILSSGSNPVLADGIHSDIKKLFANEKYVVDNSIIECINKNLTNALSKNLDEDIVKRIVPKHDQISDIFVQGGYLNKAYTPREQRQLLNVLIETLIKNVEEFNKIPGNKQLDADFIECLISNTNLESDPIRTALQKVPARVLDENLQKSIIQISDTMDDFRAKDKVLRKYIYKKVAQVEDSILAYDYNKITDKIIKILDFDKKEFFNARFDNDLMRKLLKKTYERIAANSDEYSKVMNQIADAVSELDIDIKESDITEFKKHLRNSITDSANESRGCGMEHTASGLVGLNPQSGKGSYLRTMESIVDDRINGVKYAYYRIINTLDLYRRIATLENASVLTSPNVPREIKEELLAMAKRESIQAHASDFAVKFYDLRNPHPDHNDFSNIEIDKDGNPIFKYLGKETGKKVDIPQDYKYFQRFMHLMFGDTMHNDTQSALKSKNLLDRLNQYRKDVTEILGGEKYFIKPEHIATVERESTSDQRFLLSGISEEMFTKKAQQMFNSKTWLKMFGRFFAGLLTVTVLAQFFFGRVKLPPKNMTDNKAGRYA